MPGHSYKGSTARAAAQAVFPPTPVAAFDAGSGDFTLTILKSDAHAGRPTFEGYTGFTGTGNPTTNPGDWATAVDAGANDDATHYQERFVQTNEFFIGRTRYGLNVSGWSNVVDQPM